MKDISNVLEITTKQNECSVLSALLLLLENKINEEGKNVYHVQSESKQTSSRRLRNKSDFKSD